MKVLFSERFTRSFRQAPDRVQREFGKQLGYLLRDLRPFPSVQRSTTKREVLGRLAWAKTGDVMCRMQREMTLLPGQRGCIVWSELRPRIEIECSGSSNAAERTH